MAQFPAMPLFCESLLADTDHLTDAELGVYMRLLTKLWLAPNQRFPDDDEWLARKFRRTRDQVQTELRPILREFFKTDGRQLYHKRIDKEHLHVKRTTAARSQAAKARWNKEKDACKSNAHTLTHTPEEKVRSSVPASSQVSQPLDTHPSRISNARDAARDPQPEQSRGDQTLFDDQPPSADPRPRRKRKRERVTPAYGFDQFWAAYPNKTGKPVAIEAFGRALTRALLPEIMAGLSRAIERWRNEGRDGRYIPNPSTWLNQDRWDDGAVPAEFRRMNGDGPIDYRDQYPETPW